MIKIQIPKYVAIIPDGNRRWAKERGLPTFFGHEKGFNTLIKIGRKARKLGVKIITIWAFSTENWHRSKEEINYLMMLFNNKIDEFLKEAKKEEIKIIHLGRKDRINKDLKDKIINAEQETKKYSRYYLCIALDYGGRDEIIRAINSFKKNNLKEADLSQYLDTKYLPYPDPDLIIRTGGEQRLSGFLLWQCQYSELIFIKEYLPDFSPKSFEKCIIDFSKRNRRFGK